MNIFADEEKEFIRETTDVAQRGDETRMIEIKEKVQSLKAMREAERKKMVEEKRMQQYGYAQLIMQLQMFGQLLILAKDQLISKSNVPSNTLWSPSAANWNR